MQTLLSKLDTVVAETGEGQKANTGSGKGGGDEFKRLKGQIALNIKEIRTNLKQRDELLQKGATGTKATVQMSHSIRSQLKLAREDANRLQALQRKEASKAKSKAPAVEQAENRQEVVELVFKHIEECELQEKKRYAGKNAEIRVELFSGGGRGALGTACTTSTTHGGPSSSSSSGTELPDIETQQGLQQLQRKNELIDEQLDVVAEGVQELKSIALTMRDEVKVQTAMVDEITQKVDAASTHLNTLNKKMKKTLAQTRSADRFIIDFILCIILLAIVGYIVSMVTD